MAGPWKGKEFGVLCPPPQKKSYNVMCVNPCFKLCYTKLHFWKLSSITLENVKHIKVSNHTTVLTEMIVSEYQHDGNINAKREWILQKV